MHCGNRNMIVVFLLIAGSPFMSDYFDSACEDTAPGKTAPLG
jgi:hypothetical protein